MYMDNRNIKKIILKRFYHLRCILRNPNNNFFIVDMYRIDDIDDYLCVVVKLTLTSGKKYIITDIISNNKQGRSQDD